MIDSDGRILCEGTLPNGKPCLKVLAEWKGDHIYIKRVQLLIYKPIELPMTCPNCGNISDIAKSRT